MRKTFIITGLARGGTSIVAAILYKFGIDMKKGTGNFDDLESFQTLEDDNRYKDFIKEQNNVWGIKYPGMFGERLKKVSGRVKNPHLIFVFRDPVAVYLHMDKRFIKKGLLRKIEVMAKICKSYMKTEYPALAISYEKLIVKKERIVKELAEFCKVELKDDLLQECMNLIIPEDKYKKIEEM